MIMIPVDASSILRLTLSRGNHNGVFTLEFYGHSIAVSIYKLGALVKVACAGGEKSYEHDLTSTNEYQVWLVIGFLAHKIVGDI